MPHRAGQARLALIKHESTRFQDEASAAQSDAMERSRWHEEVIELLNDSLSPELVCVLRYRPADLQESASSGAAATTVRPWPVSPSQQRADAVADRIANRIVDRIMQWEHGGTTAAAPADGEPEPGQAWVPDALPRDPMHAADVVAVRRALASTGSRPHTVDQKNPAARRQRDDALADGEEHADDWMAR